MTQDERTNDTILSTEPEVTEPPKKVRLNEEERGRVKSTLIITGVLFLAVIAVLVVGIVYGTHSQKQEAARAPRESTPTFYGALAEEDIKQDDITVAVTQLYYTAENGMMADFTLFNNRATAEKITKVIVTLYNGEDVQLAKAESAGMPGDFILAASGGEKELTVYIKPEYVSVIDDSLETIKYEVTVQYETVD